ncbi:MAG: hypothetical protein Q9191_006371 [Dirinaria sp. TL-2023a]
MSVTVWPPESQSWYASTSEDLTSSTNEQIAEFDFEHIHELTYLPSEPVLACGEPYAFTTSLAASPADFQGAENVLPSYGPPSIGLNSSEYLCGSPSYEFTPDMPVPEEHSQRFNLETSFIGTLSPGHSLFEEEHSTHESEFNTLFADTSHNIFDTISTVNGSGDCEILAPDTTTYSTPAFAPLQAPNAESEAKPIDNFSTDNQRWHATQSRSRAADRYFLYGVLTTKIFCRPSCASRRPSRRHVRFFLFPGAIEAAEQANFRPCKRCIPEVYGVKTSGPLRICKVLRTIIAEVFDKPQGWSKPAMKLEPLVRMADLSKFHFQRFFKVTTQVAPGDFINACRALALQDTLRSGSQANSHLLADVSASVDNSCWSPRTVRKALGGISPKDFANGAPSRLIYYGHAKTPCGLLYTVLSVHEHTAHASLHSVYFAEEAGEQGCQRFPTALFSDHYAARLQQCVNELEKESRDRDTELTADVLPTLWRVRIWLKFLRD